MPENKVVKIIIDTNLWISFLIGKELKELKNLLIEETIQLVISEEIVEEIILVTQRPKLQKYFTPNKVDELVRFLRTIGLFVNITSEVLFCRDPKDNYLLALAKDSDANFLVTGDQDLLVIAKFENTEIVTYQEFLLKL
ncbi:putative toxin-antitoxin system toxin component, PIN family [Dolichospermum sp. ST_con]|jgi:putative PIN family toxin of toxin-antitoxin system|nr:putative toxin-antitoxin system toxin component, PIN family [Dolichospermum sp. DET66]MBS3034537.1 putative toxin-antitoxin system toxin component, PIN family [Dolichospermum sp. DET67]MBS3039740.1 putative toxin-antitoxin system toxin component, PIN family [Dolichospermum sp. DET50]MDD1414518.1 putative toxin-antitoxin system toxin component, PIN family [Dolichospermum sp. ST_con]MDD1421371.1 putative toxin-antitoxin system toxin component, PIN family [Dolichospermum sp. ST_sed1]MDD1426807